MITFTGSLYVLYIYKITNILNNKSYVGKTEKLNPHDRWKEHLSECTKPRVSKRPLYSALIKYGQENFTFEVIEETYQPIEREVYYINFYNTYKEGYNATLGGDGASYIFNQKEIIDYFNKYQPSLKSLAAHFNHDVKTIRKILRQFDVKYTDKVYNTKPVVQKDKKGNIVNTFSGASEAASALGNLNLRPHISNCCSGSRKSAGGFTWEFLVS